MDNEQLEQLKAIQCKLSGAMAGVKIAIFFDDPEWRSQLTEEDAIAIFECIAALANLTNYDAHKEEVRRFSERVRATLNNEGDQL